MFESFVICTCAA